LTEIAACPSAASSSRGNLFGREAFAPPAYRVATPSVFHLHPIFQGLSSWIDYLFGGKLSVATPSVLQLHPIFQESVVLDRLLVHGGLPLPTRTWSPLRLFSSLSWVATPAIRRGFS
jgi:hypothetical protein